MLPMEKSTGILWHIGHVSKRCNIRGKRIEDKVEDSNICEIWGYNYKGTKTERNQEQGFISREQLKNMQYKRYLVM